MQIFFTIDVCLCSLQICVYGENYTYMYICIQVFICVYTNVHICMNVIHTHVYFCVCVCVCIHIYCIYSENTYTYVCGYTHNYTFFSQVEIMFTLRMAEQSLLWWKGLSMAGMGGHAVFGVIVPLQPIGAVTFHMPGTVHSPRNLQEPWMSLYHLRIRKLEAKGNSEDCRQKQHFRESCVKNAVFVQVNQKWNP